MLSTAMQPYASSFNPYGSSYGVMPQGHPYSPQTLPHPGLSPYPNSSPYPVQPLPQPSLSHDSPSSSRKRSASSRYGPYGSGTLGSSMGSGHGSVSEHRNHSPLTGNNPVRRRISRACDQCNQLRTRCDGQTPCAHCVEFGLSCEYNRERKKRGKASRKDIQQQQAAAAAAAANGEPVSPNGEASESRSPSEAQYNASPESMSVQELPMAASLPYSRSMSVGGPYTTTAHSETMQASHRAGSMDQIYDYGSMGHGHVDKTKRYSTHPNPSPLSATAPELRLDVFGDNQQYGRPSYQEDSDNSMLSAVTEAGQLGASYEMASMQQPYATHDYTMVSPRTNDGQITNGYGQPIMPNTTNTFLAPTPTTSASPWTSQNPSVTMQTPRSSVVDGSTSLRYPVLSPLLPYIKSILPTTLACDLLDLYFTSSSSTYMHPLSQHVLAFIFRRESVLRAVRPRQTSPALLASMLWVAAQTSEAPLLTASSRARSEICQKLLEVTFDLLNPLNHGVGGSGSSHEPQTVGLGLADLDDTAMGTVSALSDDPATIDDVVTYIHLATVMSGTNYRPTSLRWWTAAFTLAKELKLNIELPAQTADDEDADAEGDIEFESQMPADTTQISDESKEERRRVWWLLYVADRHLALCYDRPLALLDSECSTLLRPVEDEHWQLRGAADVSGRIAGPSTECTGRSLFGFLLPLMTILGDIITLKHITGSPRLSTNSVTAQFSRSMATSSTTQLEQYTQTLNDFVAHNSTDHETTRTFVHATFITQALQVLLNGPWDPSAVLSDAADKSLDSAVSHAVAAADAMARILDSDPQLSFMPFFTGPYALQTSFVLLSAVEQSASPAEGVVTALETCIRAMEARSGLLPSAHEAILCNLMRNATAKLSGKAFKTASDDDLHSQREVLKEYRWSSAGMSLAI